MKEHREDIIKLSVSGLLLIAFLIITNIFKIPTVFKIILFAVPYLIAGYEVLAEAFQNIKEGEIFDENFLMCIASIGAFCVGEYPEAVFVMIFFGVGELFEHIATDKSRHSIKALLDIRPDNATVLRDNQEITVGAKEVNVGETIVIKPGQIIALDGVISEGTTSVDNSALTGESVPAFCKEGDNVYGGCINKTSRILVTVTKSFGESTASKILKSVEECSEKKSNSERFIRKFSKVYTPVVCLLALILAVVPSIITGDFKIWIYRALMFLVVSCPCALVVSVPLSYFAGLGRSAKQGVLMKGAQYLERLAELKVAVFDKTGTLTKGCFEVTEIKSEKLSTEDILRLAAAVEKNSLHPIAISICSAINNEKLPPVSEVSEIAGKGMTAVYNKHKIFVGNKALLNENNIDYPQVDESGTVVYIATEKEYLGHIIVSDTLKDDSALSIKELKQSGIKTVMLSGDIEKNVIETANEIGIDEYYYELRPEEKVEKLEDYLKYGNTAFVGDGINDAPVLTRADVGVAMGALGSDAATEAADVVLMHDSVSGIIKAIKTAKKTQRIVKQNIAFSITVKVAVLILCATGFGVTNMWMASFADVGVLVLAVLNSIRAGKFNL